MMLIKTKTVCLDTKQICLYFWENTSLNFQCHLRYTREIPEPASFLFLHGAQIGGLQVFPNQNNQCSSGAYVTCIYCGLSMKIYHAYNTAQRAKIVDTFVCVWGGVGRNPKTPDLSPMADDAITRGGGGGGGIRGLGSPLCICECHNS